MNRRLNVYTMGGRKTGFGHVARILPIIEAFESNNCPVDIAVSGDDAVGALLSPRSFRIVNWQEVELNSLNTDDVVLIDTLDFPKAFVQSAQNLTDSVYFISDAYESHKLPVKVLNWRVNAESDGQNTSYPGLSGAKYVPLREEVLSSAKPISARNQEVIISMGSGDILNLVRPTIELLKNTLPKDYVIKAVVRSYHPQFNELKELESDRVKLIVDVSSKELFESISTCEFAVASGGHSIYEFAHLGVPVVHVLVAENQKPAQCWNETGFTYPLNFYDAKTYAHKIKAGVEFFIDEDKRFMSATIGMQLIDGKGANRTANALIQ